MDLFLATLRNESRQLHRHNIRLRLIGNREAFSAKLQHQIRRAEHLTADNTGLTLVIAANYGGRWDIARAAAQLARDVATGHLAAEAITAEHLKPYLCLSELPEPDLFIRTGGEQRISNFLLWQLAYTELYFCERLWPDFDAADLDAALAAFARRQRRFGMTAEQLGCPPGA